jgi:hypothetical protein
MDISQQLTFVNNLLRDDILDSMAAEHQLNMMEEEIITNDRGAGENLSQLSLSDLDTDFGTDSELDNLSELLFVNSSSKKDSSEEPDDSMCNLYRKAARTLASASLDQYDEHAGWFSSRRRLFL